VTDGQLKGVQEKSWAFTVSWIQSFLYCLFVLTYWWSSWDPALFIHWPILSTSQMWFLQYSRVWTTKKNNKKKP